MKSRFLKENVFVVLITSIFSFALSIAAQDQATELIGTAHLENRLKVEFKLTRNEITSIRPLIRRENENVIRTYVQYSGERYKDNFLSLWEGLRSDSWEFEGNLPTDLSAKQKKALRTARVEFESRILDLWLEDYLGTLGDLLQLNRFQVSGVQSVFENETEKRLRLIIAEMENPIRLNEDWQRLTNERERYLTVILDAQQFRLYLSLGKPDESSIAMLNCPQVYQPGSGSMEK